MADTRAITIIKRFTSDPDLTKRILGYIDAARLNRGDRMKLSAILDKEIKDPKTRAYADEIIAKVRAGHDISAITGYHEPNTEHAARAAERVHQHVGAVAHIVQS